ncbi:S1 family peptidase [Paenibacillus sp. M.A.Huq-84]
MQKWSKFLVIIIGSLYLFLNHFSLTGADPPKTYDAEELYEYANPAVFYVRVFRADGTLKDVGTGFLIKGDGTALTAYHVVNDADRITCALYEGKLEVACRIAVKDETADAAVLKLKPHIDSSGREESYPYLNLRTSTVRHGEKAFAIGYPMKDTKIITEGIVNSPRAQINGRDRILVSAQIVNGMSGGPVFDKYGNVMGIISGSLRTMNNIHLVVNTENINKMMESER